MDEQIVRRSSKAHTTGPSQDGKTLFLNDTLDKLGELDCLWCNVCHEKFGHIAYQGNIVDGCRSCWREKSFSGHPPQNFAPYVKACELARKAEERKMAVQAGTELPSSLAERTVRRSQLDTPGMRRRLSLPGRMPRMPESSSPDPHGPARNLSELQSLMAAHKANVAGRRAERLPSATRDRSRPVEAAESNSGDTNAVARRGLLKPGSQNESSIALQRMRSLPSVSAQDDYNSVKGDVNGSRRTRSGSAVRRTPSPAQGARRAASPAVIGGSQPHVLPGGRPMSAHTKNVMDSLVYFLYQSKLLSEEALRGLAPVDGRGVTESTELIRELRKFGCMLPSAQLDGLLRSVASAADGKNVEFSMFYRMVTTHAKSMGYGEGLEEPKEVERLAFELGSRVRSLVVFSSNESEFENEEGTVEGPGPTSATIAVRFDLTNQIRFMKPSQLVQVQKELVRRRSFMANRKRTL